jgi:two-component system, OmpR family, sensor histidine kinase KdpD
VAFAAVVLATLAIYPLSEVAPVTSLDVAYLPAVVVVSTLWGLWGGLATGVASAAAFNFFYLPPTWHFTVADSRNWVALGAFIVVAMATGVIGELARARAAEADQRRDEADLAAELARVLLGGARFDEALGPAGQRLATAIGVSAASIELREVAPGPRQVAFSLHGQGQPIGTLLLPAALARAERDRVAERIVPPLESLIGAMLHRAKLQAEVVETAALRRSNETNTAVLRSVSHDLRTPVTAILTAIAALDPERAAPDVVRDVRDVVAFAGTRLARLIDKLLDLTLLESGTLVPRVECYSLDEVLSEAIDGVDAPRVAFRLSLGRGIPLLLGDPGYLERAFGNLLENAARYSNGKPVAVLGQAIGGRVRVRIVDQGPGIPASEQERIFMPFYRSPDPGSRHEGSGLGLAIAKGFIRAGGGSIRVESLPGQGTSFVVDLPVAEIAAEEGDPPAAGARAGWPVGAVPARVMGGGG